MKASKLISKEQRKHEYGQYQFWKKRLNWKTSFEDFLENKKSILKTRAK